MSKIGNMVAVAIAVALSNHKQPDYLFMPVNTDIPSTFPKRRKMHKINRRNAMADR